MGRKWTEEQKQMQREVISRSKPWLKSCGPRTVAGKVVVSQNSVKHGLNRQKSDSYEILDKIGQVALEATNGRIRQRADAILEEKYMQSRRR